MNFGNAVKEQRLKKGMTQLDLAYAAKITPSAVSMWERGKAKPHYKMLTKLAKIFGVSERDLLFPQDETEKNEDSK
ncbi:MAG: helix-turn-helix transcriptional regulator [Synergistaceae bacterium]|nr:helix-turn-helix transcriptional regulator [Synergistaceae bacterium]